MLRFVAAQAETLWDEALPMEVRELPEDLAALDGLVVRSGLLAPFSAALAARGARVGGVGGRSWASDDRDRDLRAADGPQAALPVGIPNGPAPV